MFFKISIILIIILTILTLYNLYNTYSYENYDYYKSSDKKILNLVLFSKNIPEYIEMYKITRNFYKKYKNVVSIYYTYSDKEYYDQKEDIKGEETYLPGILDKTVKAFQYVPIIEKMIGEKFDYIIRTNISTIVKFDKLSEKLNGVDYGCGLNHIIVKNYRDPVSGIKDDSLEGLEFPGGTCIIFSRKLFYLILPNLYLINRNLIDDVSIGEFMRKYFGKYQLVSFNDFFIHTEIPEFSYKDIDHHIFFRNKHKDRKKDLEKMNKIVDNLSML